MRKKLQFLPGDVLLLYNTQTPTISGKKQANTAFHGALMLQPMIICTRTRSCR
jgi:hypothetical protein